MLVQKEDDLEFSHLSFQEFLAAMEIIRTNQESILHSYFHDDWWKQVILLYVSKVKKPSHLIKTALDAGAIDLALACTQETRKQIDANVKKDLQALEEQRQLQAVENEVKNSLYQQLEEYLKNQQWYEADLETYSLMIRAASKDVGQGFSSKDLKEFPCDVLLAIDNLWVKHSNGLYGFSVQKQVYVDCGGILNFSSPSDEIWNSFCERIKWKCQEMYCDTSGFFDIKSLNIHGHLPWVNGVFGSAKWKGGEKWGFSFLASRLEMSKSESELTKYQSGYSKLLDLS